MRFVERQDRGGLSAVFGHAGAHGRLVIVGAALELVMAAHIAGVRDCGQLEGVVIIGAAIGAAEAAGDPLDQRVLVHREFDDVIELAAMLVEDRIE